MSLQDNGKLNPRQWERLPVNDEKYGHATGRVRALEKRLLDEESLNKLLEAKNISTFQEVLDQAKYPKGESIQERLRQEMKTNDALLKELSGENPLAFVLLLEDDYHNLKVILKSILLHAKNEQTLDSRHSKDVSAASEDIAIKLSPEMQALIMTEAPTNVNALYQFVSDQLAGKKSWAKLDAQLAEFVQEIVQYFTASYDIAMIDQLVDKAFYKNLQELCEGETLGSAKEFVLDYLSLRADAINFQSLLRIWRANAEITLLRKSLVTGGAVSLDVFLEAHAYPGKKLADAFKKANSLMTDLVASTESYSTAADIQRFSQKRDNLLMRLAKKGLQNTFGGEAIAGFWLARRTEVQNLRIMLALRMQSQTGTKDKSILRMTYRGRA